MFERLQTLAQAGASNSLGRLRALEMFSADGNWQDGFDLQDTVLCNADCHDADLAQADFSRSDLTAANLKDADLRGANFSGADLTKADLRGALVDGAQFRGAILSRTLSDSPLPDLEGGSGSGGG